MTATVDKKVICQNCQYRLNKPNGECKAGWCTATKAYVRRKDTRAERCEHFTDKKA